MEIHNVILSTTVGKLFGIEVVPGIEISTNYDNQGIHVLGYYLNYRDKHFLSVLDEQVSQRNLRNQKVVNNLVGLGIDITLEEIENSRLDKKGNVGRPHIADTLVRKGIVSSMQEAFDVYLAKGKKAYAKTDNLTPAEAITEILKAGGVPVLAHPGNYGKIHSNIEDFIVDLLPFGLAGIEVFHSDHTSAQEKKFYELAVKYDLVITAGSDYHGERNGVIHHGDIGNRRIDNNALKLLKMKSKFYNSVPTFSEVD